MRMNPEDKNNMNPKEKNNIKEFKIEITVLTGLRIGGEKETFEIAGLDNPVLKAVFENNKKIPIIPGSSLKGKMRCMLEKKYGQDDKIINRINRLFGKEEPGRLIFSDLLPTQETLKNWEELERRGYTYNLGTEIKPENTIDRVSGRATPRMMERIVMGSKFAGVITYLVPENQEEEEEDIEILREGLKLVAKTYLGGCGSRGYGRVEISIKINGNEEKFKPEHL
ncbi:MAG: type III-A CRISPR-associated RAMP protein Csm3 [Candidatus Aenigmarchaeota archaeon]|nr:type III-A CRISPR-associated RAMP protein Csm3 [Candidatus Aenigmarchaeota archaeon]MDW8160180.1 type III-A CRISPR-associated RAMP protein Csm3 [Candidatus Aenigmarchaeota archaeon]